MSASLTMRLVPMRAWCRKRYQLFRLVSISAGDLRAVGQFLGGLIGWRNVFNGAAVMGVLCTLGAESAIASGGIGGSAAKYVSLVC